MSSYLATVYAFGFHDPKALHRLIVRNWAAVKFIRFVVVTDHAPGWTAIVPQDAVNIEVAQIDVEHLFELAFPLLGVTTFSQLKQDRGWLFTPHNFQMGGYLGCQLRPALSTLMPRERTPFWGWIDNDVLINPDPLERHLRETKAQLVLCPKTSFAWEQFKLYSTDINTTMIYKEFVDAHIARGESPPGPMEARFVYHMRDMNRYVADDVDQSRVAVHWLYTDRLAQERGRLANQYPVTISADAATLTGPNGQDILFFNADTQLKVFSDADVAGISDAFAQRGSYVFDYAPRLDP